MVKHSSLSIKKETNKVQEGRFLYWTQNFKVDEVILELETDKATQEIYSKAEGYLSKIFYKEGNRPVILVSIIWRNKSLWCN